MVKKLKLTLITNQQRNDWNIIIKSLKINPNCLIFIKRRKSLTIFERK